MCPSIHFLHFPLTCINIFIWKFKFDVHLVSFNAFLLEKYFIKNSLLKCSWRAYYALFAVLRYIYLCSRIEWSAWAYCFCLVCLSGFFFVCLFVCLSVCCQLLTFAITFELKRGGDFIFSMHTPLIKPFQMTLRSMTLWPWLWPWSKNSLLDFVANRGIVFYKHTLIFYTKTFTLWSWL